MGELRAREAYMGLTFDPKPKKQQKKASVLTVIVNDRAKKAKRARA